MRSPETDKLGQHAAERLANHWHFSTETAFRISELLDDLRHRLRYARLNYLDGILLGRTSSPTMHLEFVRRVLTGPKQEQALEDLAKSNKLLFGESSARLCYQFTGSYAFEKFRRASHRDEHSKRNLGKPINDAFSKAEKLIKEIKETGSETAIAWDTTLRALRGVCDVYQDTITKNLIQALQQKVDQYHPDPQRPVEDKFRFLSLLYVLYSRLTLVGEAVGTVSRAHFAPTEGDSPDHGLSKPLAYLLKSTPGTPSKPGNDKILLRIDERGSLSKNLLPSNYQRPPTIWFPNCRSLREGQDTQMRKLLLALWPVFNATISKKAFYDLVVPVYQSDEESCSDKKHLLVTGAFLGWLFVRIQLKTVNRILDIQKNTSAGNKLASIAANGGRVREALTEELKAIRLALNPFAEMYLLGEMEWLLEQEWGNAQDAAHFTTTHFHHCDGWIGDPSFTPPKRALLEDYFTFCRQHTKQGNDSVLEEIVEDTTSSSEITHLVVNVGRSFEFDGSPETPPIPIVLRKRPDTALPDDRGERRDYATQVAKSVRQVFDVARMRHAEHKAAISEGRNKASHSLPYTISLCLGKLRDYADAAKALENVSFPINSRDDIPRAIREFSYPIELYAYGVEYALLQERDSDAFNRLIPQVEWIDDTVREHGLTSALVGELAEKISWPLARFSLMRSGQFRSPASIPEYHIEGNIPPADLRLKDNVSARVLVAAITECIREAFHHCSGDSPEIRIMLISGSPSKVVIKNSCMSLQDPTAFKAGNQSAMLNHLQTHLGGWRIEHPPACDGGYWIRTITQVPL